MGRAPVNAFNDALWFELRDHFRAAVRASLQFRQRIRANTRIAHFSLSRQSDDNDVRCIVLASSLEKLFTAGLDLT